jgi:hypothetical protein
VGSQGWLALSAGYWLLSGRWRMGTRAGCLFGKYPKMVFDLGGSIGLEIPSVLILRRTTKWGLMHPNRVSQRDSHLGAPPGRADTSSADLKERDLFKQQRSSETWQLRRQHLEQDVFGA